MPKPLHIDRLKNVCTRFVATAETADSVCHLKALEVGQGQMELAAYLTSPRGSFKVVLRQPSGQNSPEEVISIFISGTRGWKSSLDVEYETRLQSWSFGSWDPRNKTASAAEMPSLHASGKGLSTAFVTAAENLASGECMCGAAHRKMQTLRRTAEEPACDQARRTQSRQKRGCKLRTKMVIG